MFMCLRAQMVEELKHLLQHKAQVIFWKWAHTRMWCMGFSLACNGNLSVLYDFIQNPSSLCGATKHIKAEWRMAPMSIRKAGGGYNMNSPPAGLVGGFLLISLKGIRPTAYCSDSLVKHCNACAHVHVFDSSSVPLWHARVRTKWSWL